MKRPHLYLVPDVPRRIMTDERWQKELERLSRRLDRIRALQAGHADVKEIPVEGHYVKRHWVNTHTRIIISRSKSRRKRRAA